MTGKKNRAHYFRKQFIAIRWHDHLFFKKGIQKPKITQNGSSRSQILRTLENW